MKKILLIIFCIIFINESYGQKKISGQIFDEGNNLPLIGANVTQIGTKLGTITDFDGKFELILDTKSEKLIEVTFVGYKSKTIDVSIGNDFTVNIESDAQLLNELVVVGYGKQIKSRMAGNVTKIDGNDVKAAPVVSFEQALQGKAPGVNIESVNGKLGSSNRIRVRGVGSINAGTEPLIVIDGIPVSKSNANYSGSALNPLADINTNDIASIEILKDASAKAIYGSRGSNGVILISTKSGKNGKTKIEFDLQTGTSKATGYRKFLDSKQFIDYFTKAANNSDLLDGVAFDDEDSWTTFVTDRFTRYSGHSDWRKNETNTDWQKEALRTGGLNTASLSLSGGNEMMQFFVSGNYGKYKGIVTGNDMDKYGGRVNLDFKATDKLKVGVNINSTQTFTDQVSDDNEFSTPLQLIALAPITPVRDQNGNLYDRPVTTYYNGLIDLEAARRGVKNQRNLINLYGSYAINKNLTFRVEGGSNILTTNDEAFYGFKSEVGLEPHGVATSYWYQSQDYNTNAVLNFNKEHNNNILGFDLGTEFYKSNSKSTLARGEGFASESLTTIESASKITEGRARKSSYTFLSYFGRAKYDIDGKYIFNVTGRMDGSSRFGKDNRYAFFPSFSAAWVLSKEKFISENSSLSFLKLRASYGFSGNAEIDDFGSLSLYRSGKYGGESSLRPYQYPNDKLTWEKSKEYNVGLDFGLFKNRINGEFDVYSKTTTDLLLRVPVPLLTGYSDQFQNIGELKNSGVEFILNTVNLDGKLGWNSTFSFSYNKNEVTKLAEGQDLIDRGDDRVMNVVKVGEQIGAFYGAQYAGVDPNNGDALFYKNTMDENGNITDKTSTTNDYSEANFIIIGNALPTTQVSIANNFTYKGLNLDFTFSGSFGNKIHNVAGGFMSCGACWFDNQTTDQLDSWKAPGDITNVPQARLGYSNGDQPRSSRYLSNGNFIRLKNVSVGYDFPNSITSKLGMSSLKLYISGVNLATFTKYDGWDPEVSADYLANDVDNGKTTFGVDFYSAPQAKSIVFGLRAGF